MASVCTEGGEMSGNEIKLALQQVLQAAFRQCEAANVPLTEMQRQIVQQVSQTLLLKAVAAPEAMNSDNPLDALTTMQREALLAYIQECEYNAQDWKLTLLNDWLQGRSSGPVQFLRDFYGFDWMNQIQPHHLDAYQERPESSLQVGDRIEVSSRLWEWLPEASDEEPEWIPCLVTSLTEVTEADVAYLNGVVEFENGLALEISGLNDWNQSNWRWLKSSAP
jgi:hypothetical protein